MILDIILVILGFFLLIKGADLFIDGISSTAVNFKISKIIIALTIVAFGTSAPELAISFQGMANNNGDLVLANVIGSTIVNIMLVIGLAATIVPIKVKNETIKKQLPLHLIMIIVFAILFLDKIINGTVNEISRSDGIMLFIIFLLFLYYIIGLIKKNNTNQYEDTKPKWNMTKSIIFSAIGLAAIFFGSELAVNSCTDIAKELGVSDKLITMIILVIGTSSPEIAMAVNSAKKKEFDIILGNIIGTNIFNIGFVLSLPVIIFGSVNAPNFHVVDMFIMLISGILVYIVSRDDKTISKAEGITMIAIFIVYYVYVILTGI